jgi:hypothetical protein
VASAGKLTALQVRILGTLAGLTPRWTLSGGGALAGVHTQHRTTRDLDLFYQARRALERAPEDAKARLEAVGLGVAVQQRAEAFCRFEVRDAGETTLVDLVADPVPLAEPPVEVDLGGARIWIDTAHQILVNKLCALLSRSELRDLEDVQALVGTGLDLRRALADAPAQDGGFSPLTFAWVLRQLPIAAMATALGRTEDSVRALERYRDELVEQVLAQAVPE